MCIIAYQPAGTTLTRKTVHEMFTANKDGAGYMFPLGDKVEIRKGFFSERSLWKAYRADLTAHPETDFVLHFRISTSGNVDEMNCHPHRVRADLAIAHNGVLWSMPTESEISDTVYFADEILAGLPAGWENNKSIIQLVEMGLGTSNKIALMTPAGVTLLNEDAGQWDEGRWFSNSSYKPRPIVSDYDLTWRRGGTYTAQKRDYRSAYAYAQCDVCKTHSYQTVKVAGKVKCMYCFDEEYSNGLTCT